MEFPDKEVFYYKYYSKCVHKDEPETFEICGECLTNPVNEWSHKPIMFEPSDKKEEKK